MVVGAAELVEVVVVDVGEVAGVDDEVEEDEAEVGDPVAAIWDIKCHSNFPFNRSTHSQSQPTRCNCLDMA